MSSCSMCDGGGAGAVALMNGPGPQYYFMRGASTARRWSCCPECAQGVIRVPGGGSAPPRTTGAAPTGGTGSGLRGPTGAEVAGVIDAGGRVVGELSATERERLRQESATAQANARARAEIEVARLNAQRDIEIARAGGNVAGTGEQIQLTERLDAGGGTGGGGGLSTRTDAGGMGSIPWTPILAVGGLAAVAYFLTQGKGRRGRR